MAKRWPAVVAALAVLTGGCSTRVGAATGPCRTGTVPAGGEITYVRHGRLWGVTPDGSGRRCLAGDVAAPAAWDAAGEKAVIAGDRVLQDNGQSPTGFGAGARVVLSPAGTSLVAVTVDGRLVKRPAAGGPETDMTVLDRYDSVVYHPGGQAIVAVGDGDSDQGYGIYLADSTGAVQATLAAAETTRDIGSLAWTHDGALLFVARHADRTDLHRLDLASGELTTLASTAGADQPITDVVTSPFPDGGVSWRQGRCGAGPGLATRLTIAGEPVAVPDSLSSAAPVGWLPGAALVLVRDNDPCRPDRSRPAGGDVYVLRAGQVTRVAQAVAGASVRVAHPVPPPLPENVPSDAPI
jgi:hypothetical protein